MKRLYSLLLALVCLVALPACKSSLAPGGAYVVQGQPDMAFFVADAAYQVAYQTVDAAFTFEKSNRAYLWTLSPNIKHTLDGIRPQAVKVNTEYLTARAAYIANPTATGLTGLQAVLAKMQQLVATATSVLPK